MKKYLIGLMLQELAHYEEISDERNSAKQYTVKQVQSKVKKLIPVREISSIKDLLKELKHYGEKGVESKENYDYYHFGNWVLQLNEENFYVKIYGIISNDNGENANQLDKWEHIHVT